METNLRNFTLIDGTGRAPINDAIVSVRDGKILYAGVASGWSESGEALTLDLDGQFVLPGLIDAHVHLAGSGEADSQFRAEDGAMTLKILSNAQKNLAAGITTVRDLGGWNELEFVAREWIQRGEFAGPRMCLAGRFISITEAGAEYYEGMYRVADGVDEIRKAVREQVKHGADLIKIGVTGAVLVEHGEPGATYFNEEEIRALVEEAKKFGRRVRGPCSWSGRDPKGAPGGSCFHRAWHLFVSGPGVDPLDGGTRNFSGANPQGGLGHHQRK